MNGGHAASFITVSAWNVLGAIAIGANALASVGCCVSKMCAERLGAIKGPTDPALGWIGTG